mgnify:CR=1 FL=1
MIKVSLIVPVYNAELYLEETLKCLMKQTLKEVEIILIDDGSKDKSGQICDEYAKKDTRFIVIHQKNAGMCAARNYGISIARGEYIGFADNDDIIDKDFLKDNYELASKRKADIVKFGRKTIYINEKNQTVGGETRRFSWDSIEQNEIRKNYFKLQRTGALNAVWDGFYKLELLNRCGVRFHEEFRYGCEDALFCRELAPYANKIVFNKNVYYYHCVRQTYSASAKFNDKALDKYRNACKIEKQVWEKLGLADKENGERELEIANEYLIQILFVLTSKACTYTKQQKLQYLKQIKCSEGFEMNISKSKLKKMKAINKKQAILVNLFAKNRFSLVMLITKVYKKYIDKKLKEGID